MLTPSRSSDRGWQYVSFAWHVTWPGWMAALVVLFFGHLTVRVTIVAMFATMAIGRYIRLRTLPDKWAKVLRSAGSNFPWHLATKVTLLEGGMLGLGWFLLSLIHSPRVDPEQIILFLIIPWYSLAGIVAMLAREKDAPNH